MLQVFWISGAILFFDRALELTENIPAARAWASTTSSCSPSSSSRSTCPAPWAGSSGTIRCWRGRFLAWTDEFHDEMARFCFELEWNGSPRAQGGVRAIELESPFYYLHTLCDELEAFGVRRVLVDQDPSHIVVAKGYWYQLFSRLSNVEELWLYPGTAQVLSSACASPWAVKRVLQLLQRVYIVEGKLSAPKMAELSTASEPVLGRGPSVAVERTVSPGASGVPSSLLECPSSKSGLIVAEGAVEKREESDSVDMTPGLMALLRGSGAVKSREVHLRNCEVEDGALAPLSALAQVRRTTNGFL